MRSHGRFSWTPHHTTLVILINAVCQRRFITRSTYTHEETGVRTCSPLRFTTYERWWLCKRPHLEPPALAPLDTCPLGMCDAPIV